MHFANNEEDKKDDRLFKIRKILNEVQDTYMAAYKSHKEVSIDESMVKFKVFIAHLRCPLRGSTYQHLPPRHFSPLLVKHGRHHYRDSS
ncbi:hypothetical protein Pcinc_022078 [Petrolisthes cinctipes]|uniref:PiggyBac transposable element-derived protein domain-containing protein n=1 Tax=Petrolisthes cinctipes TaxID=88211 RepID=A0AAE1KHE2_PETCI|nr:hypothetical protein Pcinc_022078 [Petrolisthes cinctipes]